jgi:TatD DNase family protein
MLPRTAWLGKRPPLRYNAWMEQGGYIDFHCHLDDPCYEGNRRDIVDRCFAAGFAKLVTVADPYEAAALERTAEIVAYHPGIACTIGAHPHNADHYSPEVERRMLDFRERFKVLAIGEVGMDLHYNFSTPENQARTFARQVALARECSLPLVIHSRQAETEVLAILAREKFPLPVVFHCFTGDGDAAREIMKRGYSLSFSGIITFKKAEELRNIVAATPLDRLFSETDSPYLSPEPNRGRTNTPLAVIQVAEKIAEIKKTELPVVLENIARNLQGLAR